MVDNHKGSNTKLHCYVLELHGYHNTGEEKKPYLKIFSSKEALRFPINLGRRDKKILNNLYLKKNHLDRSEEFINKARRRFLKIRSRHTDKFEKEFQDAFYYLSLDKDSTGNITGASLYIFQDYKYIEAVSSIDICENCKKL
ncbi:MAG: hypothetical protein GXO64_05175 [Candidatus Micrarchaeota archaeon]|nr:hypothetical protein [Candidatus Micrarchaeota archaeon]